MTQAELERLLQQAIDKANNANTQLGNQPSVSPVTVTRPTTRDELSSMLDNAITTYKPVPIQPVQVTAPVEQPKQNILQKAGSWISGVFKKSAEQDTSAEMLKRILEDKQNKLIREQQSNKPREKKINELNKEVQEIQVTLSDTSPNAMVKKLLLNQKYGNDRNIQQFKGAMVGLAKNIFDSLASLQEQQINSKKGFADKQEELIKQGFKDLNIPESEQQALMEKYSPRFQKDFTTGKSLSDREKEIQKAVESGREPFQKAMERYIDDVSPTNPTFSDQLVQGIGSMAGFYVASILTGGGAVIPSILESMGESGAVYEENKTNGKSVNEAFVASTKTFVSNLVWNAILNKFSGLFQNIGEPAIKELKKKVVKILQSSTFEGIQEAGQQLISNINTGKEDLWEGVLESLGLGAIIGGGAMGVELSTGVDVTPTTEKTSVQGGVADGGGTASGDKPKRENITKEIDQTQYEGVEQLSVNIKPDAEGNRVGDMFVVFSPDAQKQGQGSKLVSEIEQKFTEKGVSQVNINSYDTAVGFWEKMGYKIAGEVKKGLVPMTKTLEQGITSQEIKKNSTEGIVEPKTVKTKKAVNQQETVLYHGTNNEVSGELKAVSDESLSYGKGIYLTNNKKIAKEYGKNVIDIDSSKVNARTVTEKQRQDIVELFGKEQSDYINKLLGKKYNALRIPEKNGDGFEYVVYDSKAVKKVTKKPISSKKTKVEEKPKTSPKVEEKAKETKKPAKKSIGKKKAEVGKPKQKIGKTKADVKKELLAKTKGRKIVKLRNPQVTKFNTIVHKESMLGKDRHNMVLEALYSIGEYTTPTNYNLVREADKLNILMAQRENAKKTTETAPIIRQADKVINEHMRLRVKAELRMRNNISDKYEKFRESTEIIETPDERYTTKFLENPEIKGKKSLSKIFIQNLLNSKGLALKGKEVELTKSVLDTEFANQDKIDGEEFRKAVMAQIMPLDIIESDTYADYGMSNIGLYYDNAKTYILNSPFKHDHAGHFRGDFYRNIPKDNIEIREVEQNGVTRYLVVDKTIPVSEETIADVALNIASTKEDAEKWVEANSYYGSGHNVRNMDKSGLFAHFRAGDAEGDISHIVEIQSDSFQNGVGISEQKSGLLNDLDRYEKALESIMSQGEEAGRSESARRYKESIENVKEKIENLPQPTKEEQMFQTYKSVWHERTVREAIRTKALEGFKKIRFPTARTVAIIEGFSGGEGGNALPYEVSNASDPSHLEVGDHIDYGGQDMTVVDADGYNITVAPTEYVMSFDPDTYITEEIDRMWEDQIVYEFENLGVDVETVGDVAELLKVNDTLELLHKYAQIEKDVKNENTGWLQDSTSLKDRIQRGKDNLDEMKRFRELVESGVIEKEGITKETALNRDVDGVIITGVFDSENFGKPDGLSKYGFNYSYWIPVENGFRYGENTNDPAKVAESSLKAIDITIIALSNELSNAENVFNIAENDHERQLKAIKSRQKPSKDQLNNIPQDMIDKANNPDGYSFGYSMPYELEQLLKDVVEKSTNDGEIDVEQQFSIEDYETDWREEQTDNFDINNSLEGIYGSGSVFYEENNDVYVVTEGDTEGFEQPDQYDTVATIEDFTLDDYDGNQKTVLEFYEKRITPYLQKLRGDNLTLVKDNGYEWYETNITDEDSKAVTAYRIKDDFAQKGYTITDEQERQIMELNKKFFGDASVKITGQILTNKKALGAYSEGVIKILAGQANPLDTFYHEAVHKYIDVFLTVDEQVDLYMSAMKKYKTEDLAVLEERIAEDFIKYAKSRTGVTGKLKIIFEKLISRFNSYMDNQDAIEKLYQDILTPIDKRVKGNKTTAGTGAVKDSAFFKRTQEQLLMLDPARYELDESTGKYNTLNLEQDAEKAVSFLEKNPEKAVSVSLGLMDAPKGQTVNAIGIATAMKARQENNMKLYTDIINSISLRATRMGQEIVTLRGQFNDDSPENFVKRLIDARMIKMSGNTVSLAEAMGRKKPTTKKQAVEKIQKETVKLKETLSKEQSKIKLAQDIIDAMRC